MEELQEDPSLSEEHENEETPTITSAEPNSDVQPTGDMLTTVTQDGQEGLMSVDDGETYNSTNLQNDRKQTEETSLNEKKDLAVNDIDQTESSESNANSDMIKDSTPQEDVCKEENVQSLPVISDEQPEDIQSSTPVVGKLEDDQSLKKDIEQKVVASVSHASASEKVDDFAVKSSDTLQTDGESENLSLECELNENKILNVEKHLIGEETKSGSTRNESHNFISSNLITSNSPTITLENANIRSGQVGEQVGCIKEPEQMAEPELMDETLHESEPMLVNESEPVPGNKILAVNDSVPLSEPESVTMNELEPVHMNEPEQVSAQETLSVPVNESESVPVNASELPIAKESLKEPESMTELPELFESGPAKSTIRGQEPRELLTINANDPSGLVANQKQGPGTEKHEELMHVEDTPKVLASMPSLAPITDPPIVYTSTDTVVKQAMRPSLQPGILKETNPKILKDILPQSEGQQILQIPQTAPALFIQGPTPFLTPIRQIDPGISHVQKKDVAETDDLATLANAALGDQAANGMKITEENSKKEPVWCDVGIIRGTSCHVMSYYEPSFSHDQEHENISSDNLPDYANSFKIELEPGTAYKFRVCAINSCGRGPWSEVSAFKTCLPGYPGAPSSIKISKSTEGAHLSWEPPSNPAGNIIEYSVCLAVRNPPQGHGDQKGQQLAFVRVYSGPHNQTVVPNSSLAAAHIDTTSKPAIIFRIAAKNEKGFGPATQVRWLQDVVASPTGGMKPLIKKDALTSGIPIKRAKLDDF